MNYLVDANTGEVFKSFEQLSRSIQDACISVTSVPSSDQFCEFRCNPASIPKSEVRNSLLSRPDSYAVLRASKAIKGQKARVNWVDVVAPGEFKKREEDEDKLDVRQSLLWLVMQL